jgi:hypothetical protein
MLHSGAILDQTAEPVDRVTDGKLWQASEREMAMLVAIQSRLQRWARVVKASWTAGYHSAQHPGHPEDTDWPTSRVQAQQQLNGR